MKIVKPAESTHTFLFKPRYATTSTLKLFLKNENNEVEEEVTSTLFSTNNLRGITFAYTFIERDKFQIRIMEDDEVVYRGKLFATEQETQGFEITKTYLEY